MKTLKWSRWGLLSLCCAASVWGQDGGDPAELFGKLDADKDGQITAEEIPEDHRPHFERLLRRGNKDENKSLSKDEWMAAHHPDEDPQPGPGPGGPGGRGGREGRPNPGQMFERLDANKDGKLQKSEIPEQMPEPIRDLLNRVFEKTGKEEISREELMGAMGEMMRGRGRGPNEDGDRPRPDGPDGERRSEGRPDGEGPRMRDGERGPDGPGRSERGPSGLMGLLDQNHDGHLSRDEFSRAATYFSDLDRNRDGVLDPSELMGPRPDRGPGDEREMEPEGRGPRGEFGPPGGPDGRPRRDFDDRRPGEGPGPEGRDGQRGRPGFGGPRPEGGPGGPGGRFNSEEFWKLLDKDGDGAVSKDEAPERMKERFDEMDADKNGKITQEEARAAMERRLGERGPGGRGRSGEADPNGPRPARPASDDSKPAEDKPAEEKPAE